MPRTLVIMVKEPIAGRVKTRLGREIGMTCAAWWFRHQTRRLLRQLQDPRWTIVLAVSPDRARHTRAYDMRFARVAQGQGNLGRRMARALGAHPGPTVLIGGDVPGVTRTHIAHAFRVLGTRDAVFGPASDGGYWLVGLKRTRPLPRGLFRNVRWSTHHALRDTLRGIEHLRIGQIETLGDVDTAQDLSDRAAWR